MADAPVTTALARHVGLGAATHFTAKASRYASWPNLIRGISAMPATPDLEAAALA